MDTPKTIALCLSGNRRAQRRLYEHYLPYAVTVVRRFGVPEADRADVIQETFAQIFERLSSFDAKRGNFTAWLRPICVRRSVDFFRRRKLVFLELTVERSDTQEDTFDLRRYDAERLLAVIATLPVGYRTIFNLYAVDGYSHQEIGRLLGISPATSRSQYTRARKVLRDKLTANCPHQPPKCCSHAK